MNTKEEGHNSSDDQFEEEREHKYLGPQGFVFLRAEVLDQDEDHHLEVDGAATPSIGIDVEVEDRLGLLEYKVNYKI